MSAAPRDRQRRLQRRHRRERRFRLWGQAALGIALLMLLWLSLTLVRFGAPVFTSWHVAEGASPEIVALAAPYLRYDGKTLTAAAEQAIRGDSPAEALVRLEQSGKLQRRWDGSILHRVDSPRPERAGLRSALLGSILMLGLAAGLSLPIGIVSAIYLHEFAPRTGLGGRLARALDILINNLAAVPAIVYGLLGLAVFVGVFGLTRSVVLTGGLVLALRIFPTVIISSRAALSAVPDTMVDGALSLGASHMQAVFGHKLPLATPGLLTGAILALAQALGEAAPLLLIGMVAYFTQSPQSLADPGTALPVQIFMWAEGGDPVWTERAAGAILVLLLALLAFNLLAAGLRGRLGALGRGPGAQ